MLALISRRESFYTPLRPLLGGAPWESGAGVAMGLALDVGGGEAVAAEVVREGGDVVGVGEEVEAVFDEVEDVKVRDVVGSSVVELRGGLGEGPISAGNREGSKAAVEVGGAVGVVHVRIIPTSTYLVKDLCHLFSRASADF